MPDTFVALMIEDHDGRPKSRFKTIAIEDLPDHEVLVEVAYSTVNYKDALAVTGRAKIARRLPMIAGIDLAGTVAESRSAGWKPGDRVMVNGRGLSEMHWGGFSRFQRLKPEWLMRVPEAFTLAQAMGIGTAGYTAALCIDALEQHGGIRNRDGEVLVTGASGGVGSVATALLAKAGHRVVVSTGRLQMSDYLLGLGAETVIDRLAFLGSGGAPFAEGALGRRGRQRGRPDPRQCPGPDLLSWSGRSLRPCRIGRTSRLRPAFHPARDLAHRRRERRSSPVSMRDAAWARLECAP